MVPLRLVRWGGAGWRRFLGFFSVTVAVAAKRAVVPPACLGPWIRKRRQGTISDFACMAGFNAGRWAEVR